MRLLLTLIIMASFVCSHVQTVYAEKTPDYPQFLFKNYKEMPIWLSSDFEGSDRTLLESSILESFRRQGFNPYILKDKWEFEKTGKLDHYIYINADNFKFGRFIRTHCIRKIKIEHNKKSYDAWVPAQEGEVRNGSNVSIDQFLSMLVGQLDNLLVRIKDQNAMVK